MCKIRSVSILFKKCNMIHFAYSKHSAQPFEHPGFCVCFCFGGKEFLFFERIFMRFFQKKTSSGMFFFVQTIFFPWKCTPTEAIINNMPLCKIWSWWDNSYDMTSNHKISFLFFIILPSMAHFENDILISHKKNLFGVFCWLRLFQLFVYNFYGVKCWV